MTVRSTRQRLQLLFPGTSEVARELRARDWSATPLGEPENWPESLRSAIRLMLVTRSPMWVGWGPDLLFLYNDACRKTMAERHPGALGKPLRSVLLAAGAPLLECIAEVRRTGRGAWKPSLALLLDRYGDPQETYHNFSCSPLFDDQGAVAGVLCTETDDTERVINERRLATLSRLADCLGQVDNRPDLFQAVSRCLNENLHDLPFSLVYAFNGTGSAWLACTSGMEFGNPCAPLNLDEEQLQNWQLKRLWDSDEPFELPVPAALTTLPRGAWDRPPERLAVVGLASRALQPPSGALIVGMNPYRRQDSGYLRFIGLVGAQIGATLARVDAIDAERRRVQVLSAVAWRKQEVAEHLRLANEDLAAERDRLQALFRQAPGFICVLRGPDHVYELVNEAYERLVGPRPLLGRSVREALPEMEEQGFIELLDQVLTSGRPYIGRRVAVEMRRGPKASGELLHLNFVCQPILEADGSVSGIFIEGSDVSDQVYAEEALQRLNETLETKVAERTLALAEALQQLRDEAAQREAVQEALRHSQKMEAVGQLTGGIAHDFNNMLTGIMGALELMQRRLSSGRVDDLERYVTAASASAQKAAALTHRLLAFSRRQPLAPVRVDANQLLESMEELLKHSIGEHISLQLRQAARLWPVLCDANQLENALLNLALNARDAMERGGQLIIDTANRRLDGVHLLGSREPVSGDFVRVRVSDSGVGMPAQVLERAFEPFFTTKAIGKGTGLGLSMVYGFARQSGGYLDIESTLGEGTRVSVYLPRYNGPEQGESSSGEDQPEAQRAHGETVLVVEDQEGVRRMVVEVLDELGCRTLEAADGPAGLKILESGTPVDLLLTDIGLPGLNGRLMSDLARIRRPNLKVLFMTGYAPHGVLPDGVLKEGTGLLTKPFSVQSLASRVLEMLGEEQPQV